MIKADNLTNQDAWDLFAEFINLDELVDEVALAARENSHGRAAYEILRRASDDTIPTLEARLYVIGTRS